MKSGLVVRWETRQYLVELYLSGRDARELDRVAARAAEAAEALKRQGKSIRYLRSIFVPAEETCFHLYAAASAVEVHEVSERAGFRPERIVEVLEARTTEQFPEGRATRDKAPR